MADLQHIMHTLRDGTGGGSAPAEKSEGDAPGVGSNVFAFKDSSGNLDLPQLNSDGSIPVSEAELPILSDLGNVVAGNQGSDVQAAVITLTASLDYRNPQMIISSTKTVLWKLIQHDNGADTLLAEYITGPGNFSANEAFEKIKFQAGATGTQELRLFGKQIQGDNSDLHAGLQVEQG